MEKEKEARSARKKLISSADLLCYEVRALLDIESGSMYSTAVLKKAVQDSIKELCTTILESVTVD